MFVVRIENLKNLVLFTICSKCKNGDEKLFKEDE